MAAVVLPAAIYQRIIGDWTSPTERLIYPSRAVELPDGKMQFDVPDVLMERIQQDYLLDGESFADCIERLLAEAAGQIS